MEQVGEHADFKERGKRLREARKAKHLTQDELAEKASIHRTSVSRHEKGSLGITREAAEKYEGALDVAADDLAQVISPSLLASLRELERHVRILALRGLPSDGMAAEPSVEEVEDALRWILATHEPPGETG